ncbi:MAG: hypothetical protein ABWW66_01990 [Archaeoglobaceae archaeon]
MGSVISTGIGLLDYRLDGGVPVGSFVCVDGDPLAMLEVFLYHFASAAKSVYVTTSRFAEDVKADFARFGIDARNVKFVDLFASCFGGDCLKGLRGGHQILGGRFGARG